MNAKDLFSRCLLLLLGLAQGLPAQAADQGSPLIVGVAPYLSTRTLLAVYRPLQTHFQGHLGSPVEVFTAVDFRAFYGNAIDGDYDLAIMPAHFARLAQRERGFVPLARYTSGGRGLLVTKGTSRIAKIDDLRGEVVAAPDRLALGAIVVFEWMRAQGIRPDQDFIVFQTPSFNSAMHALDNGDAVGAVSAPAALAQMAPVLRGDIRVIADAGEFQNLVFLGHPRLTPEMLARLKAALLGFARDPDAGRQFLAETGFGDLVEVAPDDLRPLDPYLAETKRLLALPQPAR